MDTQALRKNYIYEYNYIKSWIQKNVYSCLLKSLHNFIFSNAYNFVTIIMLSKPPRTSKDVKT